MRSPSDRTFGSNIISPYAPKWARDLTKTERRSLMRKVYDRDLPPIDIAPANGELNIEQIFQQAVASAVPLDPPEPRPIEPRPTKPVSPRQDTEQAFLQVEHTLRKLTQLAADNEPPQPEQNLFINDFRVPRSLDPHTMSEPWSEPWPAQ